ncbi:MAG: SDR family oxidoreductase [Verrucomicrobiota bacterium]
MDLLISDNVYLVTGGASGIGEAIVRQLAAEGAKPVIVDRNEDRATSLAAELGVKAVVCDLTDDAEVASALKEFDRIDGVVNNAGLNDGAGIGAGPKPFRQSLEMNLVQAYAIVHHAAPALRQSKGAIVNIASKVAMTGQGGNSGYAAAKGGLVSLTREWALDLAKDEVRVNAVIPAEVWTPMYEYWLEKQANPEARKAEIESRIPLGSRMTSTDEIAAMTVFLLSPRSSHTTGQLVHVDGGYVHFDRSYQS